MATDMTEPKFEPGDFVNYVWSGSHWTARVVAVTGLVEDQRYKPLQRWEAHWRYRIKFLDGDTADVHEASLRPLPNVISLPLPRCEWSALPGGTAA